MYNRRENNYDLLRVVSAIAVISIHVSMKYLQIAECVAWLINILARFSVPCFIMTSGAFHLSNEENMQYTYFYKKCIKSIGVHTINFSIFYFLFSEVISVIIHRGGVFGPIFQWMAGRPFYHMWYLYMMIGVYLLVPILMHLKKEIGSTFDKIVIFFFPFAVLSIWTSQFELEWNLGNSFCYISYFAMGYVIRKKCYKKNNIKGCFCLIFGILIEVLVFYMQRYCILNFKYKIYAPCSPFIAVASLFIFLGFSFFNIKQVFEKIAVLTIYIYLFHAGIWEVLYKAEQMILANGIERVIVPVIIINIAIVFILSIIASAIYRSMWTIVDQKFEITDRLIKIIK